MKSQTETAIVQSLKAGQGVHNATLSASVEKSLSDLKIRFKFDQSSKKIQDEIDGFYAYNKYNKELGVGCQLSPKALAWLEQIIKASSSATPVFQKIGEVLALVWRALHDHDQIADGLSIASGQPVPLNKVKGDLPFRIETLFNTIEELVEHPVCPYGTRNAFALVLNKIHPLVNLLEEYRPAALHFLRDTMSDAFFKQYDAPSIPPETQALLIQNWMTWIKDDDMTALLLQLFGVNARETLADGLNVFFMKHGLDYINFIKNPTIDVLIQDVLSAVTLSYQHPSHHILQALANILSIPILPSSSEEDKHYSFAVEKMQSWIMGMYDHANPTHRESVVCFDRFNTVRVEMVDHQELLEIAQEMTPELHALRESSRTYFSNYVSDCADAMPAITQDDVKGLQEIIATAKKNTCHNHIVNFFALWFAVESGDPERERLYRQLRSTVFQEKIRVTDAILHAWLVIEAPSDVITLTPYHLNRLFLHAIIHSPKDWTPAFFNALSEVVRWVADDCLERQSATPAAAGAAQSLELSAAPFRLSSVLTKFSYPKPLLAELEYFLNRYALLHPAAAAVESMPRPSDMLVLPNDAESISELADILNLLSSAEAEAFLQKNHIKFFSRIIQTPDQLITFWHRLRAEKWITFYHAIGIGKLFFVNLIQNNKGLIKALHIVKRHPRLNALKIFEKSKPGFLAGVINNTEELIDTLRCLSEDCQIGLFEILEQSKPGFLASIVSDRVELERIFYALSEKSQIDFFEQVDPVILTNVIENSTGLFLFLFNVEQKNQYSILKKANPRFLDAIIADCSDLGMILDGVAEADQFAFIESLGNRNQAFLGKVVKNNNELVKIFESFPRENQSYFLAWLTDKKTGFLASRIKDNQELTNILNVLSGRVQFYFLQCLETERPGFLAECVKNNKGFADVLLHFMPNNIFAKLNIHPLLERSKRQFSVDRIRAALRDDRYQLLYVACNLSEKFNSLFNEINENSSPVILKHLFDFACKIESDALLPVFSEFAQALKIDLAGDPYVSPLLSIALTELLIAIASLVAITVGAPCMPVMVAAGGLAIVGFFGAKKVTEARAAEAYRERLTQGAGSQEMASAILAF